MGNSTPTKSSTLRVAQAAGLIVIITAFSKLYGFIREAVFASQFGATMQADAFLVALVIPAMMFATIGAALATTFIPVFGSRLVHSGEESANRFANNVVNTTMIIVAVFLVLTFLFIRPIVQVVAPGLSGEAADLTIRLARIMLLAMPFMALSAWATGFLQARQHFFLPAAIGFPFSTIYIIFTFLASGSGNMALLALGVVLAYGSQFLLQAPMLFRYRYRYRPWLNVKDEDLRQMALLILPILISTGAAQLNIVVDRMLASGLETGSIAALNYAQKLYGLPTGLLILPIVTALYPSFVQFTASDEMPRFLRGVRQGINVINLALMPILVGIVVLSEDMVRLAFERGAFDERATQLTSYALVFYILGLAAHGWRELLNRAFFALQDTKTPMWSGVATMGSNIVLNLLLVGPLGVGGLALATSIGMGIGTVVLVVILRRRAGAIGGRSILLSLVKTGSASLIMGAVVWWLRGVLPGAGDSALMQAVNLAILIGSGALVYGAMVLLFRVEELQLGKMMLEKVMGRVPGLRRVAGR